MTLYVLKIRLQKRVRLFQIILDPFVHSGYEYIRLLHQKLTAKVVRQAGDHVPLSEIHITDGDPISSNHNL